MKEIIKKISFKKVLWLLWLILVLFESYNMFIDFYNFSQFKKAKPILESLTWNEKTFYNINDFNKIYDAWIKPIKNCYVINNNNWKEQYLFWFQLESFIFKKIYWTSEYSYPSYDMPYVSVCFWTCYDKWKRSFTKVISNPCEE